MMKEQQALAPVVEDMSAYIVAGRLASQLPAGQKFETSVRTPRQGLSDAVEAERLGFRRVFLAERWNIKEASVILGSVGALTTRLEMGTGVISPSTRHPLHAAAYGATMHACHGPRFILGLGRSDPNFMKGMDMKISTTAGLVDYVKIVRRLWAGETVSYEGPAGRYENIVLGDTYHGPAPKVFYGTFGGPLAAKAAAAVFDGVLLPCCLTPQAVHDAAARIRRECEAIGRDPASMRICICVITAPDLSDEETRELAHARAVTYLQIPSYSAPLVKANGWDQAVIDQLFAHKQFKNLKAPVADLAFHRVELLEPAKLIPDEWMRDSCALGSLDECLKSLARFREAGADEVITYGSTPGQNAKLIAAWRERKAA